MKRGVGVGARRPPARGPAVGLETNLAGALDLGCVRLPRALAFPEVEDARRVAALLGRLGPVPSGERPVLLPRPTRDLDAAFPVAPDSEEADHRWLALGPDRLRVLPPVAFEAGQPALVLDRLSQLLVHLPHVGGREALRVPNRGHAEEIGGQ